MKRTPWFDGDTKPVHVGVYETNLFSMEPQFSRWASGQEGITPLRAMEVANALEGYYK